MGGVVSDTVGDPSESSEWSRYFALWSLRCAVSTSARPDGPTAAQCETWPFVAGRSLMPPSVPRCRILVFILAHKAHNRLGRILQTEVKHGEYTL